MFDPAALGTLIIGLEAIRREDEPTPRRSTAPPRSTRLALGPALAARLRLVADHLDRPTAVGAGTGA